MYLCLSSGSRPRYKRDIIRAFDRYHARQNGRLEDGVGTSLDPEALSGEEPEPAGETRAPDDEPGDDPGRGPSL